jgi:hypothetical protein
LEEDTGGNFLCNGDFEQPRVENWDTYTSKNIPCWESTSNTIELGEGSLYVTSEEKLSQVVQLATKSSIRN